MKNFLKISFMMLALLLCTLSWAGDDLKGKGKTAKESNKPAEEEIKVRIIAVRGLYEGIASNGNGTYCIRCREPKEQICFLINDVGVWTITIPDTGETIEVQGYLGSEQHQGYTNHYFTVPQ